MSPGIGDRRDSAGRWGAAWRDRVCPTAVATGGTDRVKSWLLACERSSGRSIAGVAASPGGAGARGRRRRARFCSRRRVGPTSPRTTASTWSLARSLQARRSARVGGLSALAPVGSSGHQRISARRVIVCAGSACLLGRCDAIPPSLVGARRITQSANRSLTAVVRRSRRCC